MSRRHWMKEVRRRLGSIVMAFVVVLGGATAIVVATAAPAQAANCGAVLVKASDWLGGSGVDVHSNGSYMETGTACANNDTEVYNLDATPPQYGYGWQCVELIERLYVSKGWSSTMYLTGGMAKSLYTDAVNGKFGSSIVAHANGSNYTPVPGDVIVHSNGTYGHVAVVSSISGSIISAVDQNRSYTGRESYGFDSATGKVSMSGATISGVVHSTSNSNTNSGGGTGSGSFRTAFQANVGRLFTYDSANGTADLQQGMKAGTSPSIVHLTGGGYEEAFQSNGGVLVVVGNAGNLNVGAGMKAGTSPSIAALSNNRYMVAFQTNSGKLYVYGSGVNRNTGLGMMAGTSPSITGSPDGSGYRVAFQANTGRLFTYDSTLGATDLQQGMMAGTNPAITSLAFGGYEEAFQANTGALVIVGDVDNLNTGAGMASGTSPSIANASDGSFRVAFQANTGMLFTYDSNDGTSDLQGGMMAGTNPGITRVQGGTGYEEVFQANTGSLIVYGDSQNLDIGAGMMSGTSPDIG